MNFRVIINCEPLTFQVSFRQSPSKTISSTYDDKVNFKLPLYIYKIDKNGKFNLEQKNNTNFEESPNDKIFVTPYDINDIKPISNKNIYNFEFIIKIKDKSNKFYELSNDGKMTIEEKNNSKIDLTSYIITFNW